MKVRALANLSGPFGRKSKDETFDLKADAARDLVSRKLAEEVTVAAAAEPVAVDKPAKADKPKKEA